MAGMFYDYSQAAEQLNCSEWVLKSLVRKGVLREFRDGPNLLIKVDELEEYKNNLETELEGIEDTLKYCSALVWRDNTLFFQDSGGRAISCWRGVCKAAASVCSEHFEIPLNYDGGPDVDNHVVIQKALETP